MEFEPHRTVYCGPSTGAEARAVAQMIAKQFSPIELRADRLCHTERYTKTLFVQFQESTAARQMFDVAAAGYSCQSNYILNPHLSLLYKTLPEVPGPALASGLRRGAWGTVANERRAPAGAWLERGAARLKFADASRQSPP